jgi:hypothetical protein
MPTGEQQPPRRSWLSIRAEERRVRPDGYLSLAMLREVLRYVFVMGCSTTYAAAMARMSRPPVAESLRRAKRAGLTNWQSVEGLTDAQLEAILFPAKAPNESPITDTAPTPAQSSAFVTRSRW